MVECNIKAKTKMEKRKSGKKMKMIWMPQTNLWTSICNQIFERDRLTNMAFKVQWGVET